MIYPDASAVVALFRTEAHSEQALSILRSTERQTSDFTVAEVSAALARQYRGRTGGAGELTAMLRVVDAWFASGRQPISMISSDVREATALVRRLDLRLRTPDALHLALCRRAGASLLTFDAIQSEAAALLGIPLAV